MDASFLEKLSRDDTIAAPATIVGHCALALIRISGPNTLSLISSHFSTISSHTLQDPQPRHVYLGWWNDDAERVDQVCMVYYQAPHSYTGQDMAELTCHGGRATVARLLRSLVQSGVRLADGGEFTLRAFLHGKIDLNEAEAIDEMVGARNERARRLAMHQLSGHLSQIMETMKTQLADVAVNVESALEFPDQDLGEQDQQLLVEMFTSLRKKVGKLLANARQETLYQRAHSIVLLGRPNVGKSTLLNAILGRERALVSSIAGTTRDLLEEELLIGGRVFKLTDGAGIHDTDDTVEKLGIARILESAGNAWAVLLVVEAGQADAISREVEYLLSQLGKRPEIALVAVNKIDLYDGKQVEIAQLDGCYPVSALNGVGIEALLAGTVETLGGDAPTESEDDFLLSQRQTQGLESLSDALSLSLEMLEEGATMDLLAQSIRDSHSILGELLGETVQPDLLGDIFSRFCIGK
jgi:tRNA modification GTPase